MGIDNLVDVSSESHYNNFSERKPIILIVDDDEEHLLLLKLFFMNKNSNYDYKTFLSPDRALSYIKTVQRENYILEDNLKRDVSLIISDFNMFPKNGLQFFNDLKKYGFSVPFVLVSSFLSDKMKNEAKKHGIDFCYSKNSNLINTVEEILPQLQNVC